MDFSHAADTDSFPEVDVAGNGGGAGVEPGTCLLIYGRKDCGDEKMGYRVRRKYEDGVPVD